MSDRIKRGLIIETQNLQGVGASYTYFTPKQGYKLIHAELTTWTGKISIAVDNAASIVSWSETIPEGTTLSVNLYFIKF